MMGGCYSCLFSMKLHSLHNILNIYDAFLFLTVVDCGTLNDPANGHVSHTAGTTFGQTATYTCNTGYRLVGDSNQTCQATGRWSGSAPTCQGMFLLTHMCACA